MRILFIIHQIDFIDPLGIMLLSAILKKNGHQTFIGVLAKKSILDQIAQIRPQIIAYSATTGEHKHYLVFNEYIKRAYPAIFTIMGGAHPTFFPQVIDKSNLDAICIGEGEEAFLELVEALEKNKPVTDIKNIATKDKINEVRNLVTDLDALPFPDRDLFYKNTELGRLPLRSFMASRGCPYDCAYCFNHKFRQLYKNKGLLLRRRSVRNIIEEILTVKKDYPIGFIKFYDDIFAHSNDAWLQEFSKEYKKEIGIDFHCLTRADLISEDIARLLKRAGCRSISMSIEAANPHIRNEVLKRKMSDEDIYRGFKTVKKHAIRIFSNSILAIPSSTTEDDIATVEMNIKAEVDFAEFPIYYPYPRTELGRLCEDEGIFAADFDHLHTSYMYESPLTCFSKKEKRIQKNISTLGTVAVAFPILKNLILKHLIYLPYNFLYFLAYLFTKMFLNKTQIYPFSIKNPKLFFQLFIKGFKIDLFKHYREKLWQKY